MKTLNLCAMVALASCAQAYGAITVIQHTGNILASDWQAVDVAGQVTITIITSYTDRVYVFEATENSQPAPIAGVDTIVTSGTIRLMIAGDENCSTPGAAALKRIDIDPAGVTSIIECINITGDFLGTEAMTVDSITGAVSVGDGVGDDLLNDITVNGDLDGALSIVRKSAGAITITGDVNAAIFIGASSNGPITIGGALRQKITVLGNLNSRIAVTGAHEASTLQISGDVSGDQGPAIEVGSVSEAAFLHIFGSLRSGSAVVVHGDVSGKFLIGGGSIPEMEGRLHVEGSVTSTGLLQFNVDISDDPGQSVEVQVDGELAGQIDILDTTEFGPIYVVRTGAVIQIGQGTVPPGNVTGSIDLDRVDGVIDIGGDLAGTLTTMGDVNGAIDIGGDLAGTLTMHDRLWGTIDVAGSVLSGGQMEFVYPVEDTAVVHVGGDVAGTVLRHQNYEGVFEIDGSLTATGLIQGVPEAGLRPFAGVLVVNADSDGNDNLDGQFTVTGSMPGSVQILTDQSLAFPDNGGDLNGVIDVGRNIASVVTTPSIMIEGEIGAAATIHCERARTRNAGDNDEAVLHFSLNGSGFLISATTPVEFGDPNQPFSGGDPAHTDFRFDITIEQGPSSIEPKAEVLADATTLPTGELYDLRFYSTDGTDFDLAHFQDVTTTCSKCDLQVHNIVVEGDLNVGDFDPAIILSFTPVNSIFVKGTLGDQIEVQSLGLLAFGELENSFCIPRDDETCDNLGLGGSTPIITEFNNTQYVAANEYKKPALPTLHWFYNHADNSVGFTRKMNYNLTADVVFYHRNALGECILEGSTADNLWCCAKGPVSDINADGRVDLNDFASFALAFGFGWTWDPQDTPAFTISGDFPRLTIRCDLDLNGSVNLFDFATFSLQFGKLGDGTLEVCGDPCLPVSGGGTGDAVPSSTLADTGADFLFDGVGPTGYIASIISGTGVNTGEHKIAGATTTELTLESDPGDSGGAEDVLYEVYALDLDAIESFVANDLALEMGGDPDWVDDVNAVLDVLQGYSGLAYDDLVTSLDDINFRPTNDDDSMTLQKNPMFGAVFGFGGKYADVDEDDLKVSIVTNPTHGWLCCSVADPATGSLLQINYHPDQDYTGPDSFTWKVEELNTTELYESSPYATVSITVTE